MDPRFIFPEVQRSDIRHDCFDADLPLIDLAPVLKLRRLQREAGKNSDSESEDLLQKELEQCEEARASVAREIRSACEEHGFFQVVNHGFPMEVVDKLIESARQLFDLPIEEKMKAAHTPSTKAIPIRSPGYVPTIRANTYKKVGKLSWHEAFGMDFPEVQDPGRLERDVTALWPEEPDRTSKGLQLRSLGEQYGQQANSLSQLVLDLMAVSLGLPEGTMQGSRGGSSQAHLEARCNVVKYPICPLPELTLGTVSHTDPSLITLVHQDHVGGLQIRFKDGSWHGVRPIQGAFVVNVGNFLQALTNRRFISAEHRVVVNSRAARWSIVYFVLNNMDSIFSPRPELVDAEHPVLYRPFTRRQYLAALREFGQVADKRYITCFIKSFSTLLRPKLCQSSLTGRIRAIQSIPYVISRLDMIFICSIENFTEVFQHQQ